MNKKLDIKLANLYLRRSQDFLEQIEILYYNISTANPDKFSMKRKLIIEIFDYLFYGENYSIVSDFVKERVLDYYGSHVHLIYMMFNNLVDNENNLNQFMRDWKRPSFDQIKDTLRIEYDFILRELQNESD